MARYSAALDDLKNALLAADPSAVLVSPRLLCRVIQQVHNLPSQFVRVPHRKTLIIDRHLLFHHVDQDDLHLDADRLLLPTVILLARPSTEHLTQLSRESILREYWQRLFHANVHLALERHFAEAKLTPRDIEARIERIGRVEFDEIRAVLHQEQYLFPSADDQEVYIEFAAVYLELRYFARNLCAVYFPALKDLGQIDRLLAQDIDAHAIFTATRLPGAPDPVEKTDTRSDEPSDLYWRLVRAAKRAGRAGNMVRAAILRSRAAHVAPAALTQVADEEAQADLQQLNTRIQAALRLNDDEARQWLQVLPSLLDKADQGHWTVEACMLYDLQKVCIDHEREIYTLDLVEWALSAGKRPIRRPLPGQRLVRITRHLRSAARRLTMARVPDLQRQQLTRLIDQSLRQSEARVRARFRPILTDAFQDVGLQPTSAPEYTAFYKMIEEMLDRITEYGFLTFSDLRDVISRNNLKLPDLIDPQEFVRGDLLLRLDRRLAASLDGVYRPSEVYLRLLERLTSLNFGTRTGRLFTQYVTLPIGGALVLLEGLQILLGHLPLKGWQLPIFGPLSVLGALLFPRDPEAPVAPESLSPDSISLITAPPSQHEVAPVLSLLWFIVVSLFLFGLLHVEPMRRRVKHLGLQAYRLARHYLVDLPARMIPIPILRRIWRSWPFQLFWWYFCKPFLVCAVMALPFPDLLATPVHAGIAFLIANLLVNSRTGVAVTDLMLQGVLQLCDWLRSGLLQNLFRLLIRIFKQVTDTVEYVLYTVDEWLRFRSGEGWASLTTRIILGLLWFPISYAARIYMLVLIEPGINPIKFPVSCVAAKFIYPMTLSIGLTELIARPLRPFIGDVLAQLFAFSTMWLLPDAFGFLFWETKENWSLYRANRPRCLRPSPIGHHGETMVQLLRPGFHSGTIPKLFTQLRWAERTAPRTGNWRPARAAWHALEGVREALAQFLDRDVLLLLHQSLSWQERNLSVGLIRLASNRIRVAFHHPDYPDEPFTVAFEEQGGWFIAGTEEEGWLRHLRPDQLGALAWAMAGLYKWAGTDLVREQIQANLPPRFTRYGVVDHQLRLTYETSEGSQVEYRFDAEQGQFVPLASANGQGLPVVEASQLLFAWMPLTWEQWVMFWEHEPNSRPGTIPFPLSLRSTEATIATVSSGDNRIPMADAGPAQPPQLTGNSQVPRG